MENCIFCSIVNGDIPADKLYEDDKVLFFYDINPQAKIHVLGIPKKNVVSLSDFISNSEKEEVTYFFKKTIDVIQDLGLTKNGYRLITNEGLDSNQEVPHFHIHILGGNNLGGLF